METSQALNELQKVLRTYRSAEYLEEVLKTALAAEQHQSELNLACKELEQKHKVLAEEVSAVSTSLVEEKQQYAKSSATLKLEYEVLSAKYQQQEDAAHKAVENARKEYSTKVEEFEDDFNRKRLECDDLLASLHQRISNAQTLLEDTRSKFRDVVA